MPTEIEYAVAILSEMVMQLRDRHVPAVCINHAVMNTCGNLCGNHYDYVVGKVIGPGDWHTR